MWSANDFMFYNYKTMFVNTEVMFLCHVYGTVQVAMFALYTDEIDWPFWSSLFSHLHNCECFFQDELRPGK